MQDDINFDIPSVMAVINVTDDSFYVGSRASGLAQIESMARQAIEQGADIIDIGGCSTRPGAEVVSAKVEKQRVIEAVSVVKNLSPDAVVSVDTFRAEVAEAVLGISNDCIINDISAGEFEPEILDIVAEYDVPYVAMHTRGRPFEMMNNVVYDDVVEDVREYLNCKVMQLLEKGISKIILDPGFGFAKTVEQNYKLLSGLSHICDLGYPVLVGLSRKSMIYKPLGITPAEALIGTSVLDWEALRQGAKILRVHDVREAVEVVKLFRCFGQNKM